MHLLLDLDLLYVIIVFYVSRGRGFDYLLRLDLRFLDQFGLHLSVLGGDGLEVLLAERLLHLDLLLVLLGLAVDRSWLQF